MNKIPKALIKDVITLTNHRNQHIYVLGTCHISLKSCDDVKLLIESIKPKVVFVELCQERKSILLNNYTLDNDITTKDIIKKLMNGELNLFALLYSSILKSIMKDLDIKPGNEFKVAYDTAIANNIEVILGDRLVHITLNRLWNGLSCYHKIKLIFELLFSSDTIIGSNKQIQESLDEILADKDLLSNEIKKLGYKYPWVLESLIHERDKYMVLELYQTLEEIEDGDMVAIVGAGHVSGMNNQWQLQLKRTFEESAMLYKFIQFTVPHNISKNEFRKYADSITKDST